MSFQSFDMTEIKETKKKYAQEVTERWENTNVFTQNQKKSNSYPPENWQKIQEEAEEIYEGFLANMDKSIEDEVVHDLVDLWQQHISKYYYDCNN